MASFGLYRTESNYNELRSGICKNRDNLLFFHYPLPIPCLPVAPW